MCGSACVCCEEAREGRLAFTCGERVSAQSRASCAAHFDELRRVYGEVVCVNLIDKKSDQRMLGDAYEAAVGALGRADVRYARARA